jgi:hypothetical protein
MMANKQKFYLAPDIVLSYILGRDPKVKELVEKHDRIVTSALTFYEVISAMTQDEIKEHAKTIKYLLETIPIVDTKSVQSSSRANKLRRLVR